MKIKAAVFDIDGTLVPYGAPGPSQAAVQALRELEQSGVAVVIATGRARYTAQWVLGSGIKPDYFAAVNGADVTDAAGRPVWQSRMTPEEMYALVDFCEDHELPLEFIFSDAYYVYVEYAAFVEKYRGQNAASVFFDSVLRDGEDQVRHLQDMPFGACAAMDARHAAAFEAKYGHLGLRFIPFAPGRYDVLRAGAGKAAGVGRLLERLGISWAETAAFGDGENDAELLEAAGFAVAMEGGAQSLLPLADAVAPAAALEEKMAFPPVYSPESRTLIVGTWPSPKSREQGFFYGHPQNRFWPLLARLLGAPVPQSVPEKKALILTHGLALWDTIESCTITGASDASIRDVVPADIAGLARKAPIRRVLCNGATAYRLYEKYSRVPGLEAVKLPSTSPANAAWTMDKLAAAWGNYLGEKAAPDAERL